MLKNNPATISPALPKATITTMKRELLAAEGNAIAHNTSKIKPMSIKNDANQRFFFIIPPMAQMTITLMTAQSSGRSGLPHSSRFLEAS